MNLSDGATFSPFSLQHQAQSLHLPEPAKSWRNPCNLMPQGGPREEFEGFKCYSSAQIATQKPVDRALIA
jgi:hypothetical protein